MPDIDDVRGVSVATVHALTTAAMIVGVPVLLAQRLVARSRGRRTPHPIGVPAVATLIAAGFTITTQRAAWALVRLWLRIDEPRQTAGSEHRRSRR